MFVLSACETPYRLEQNPVVSGSSGATPTATPSVVVCDPFNSGSNQTSKNGIQAKLTYVDNYQASASHLRSTADFEPGMPDIITAPAEIFLSKLDVPLRAWDAGFMMSNGELLKKSDGEALFEGFSLRMASTFVAPNAGAEGDYQFAILSDDGAILRVAGSGNSYSTLVDNDGVHAVETSCADRTVRISKDQPLAFKIDYFQGPRMHIALQLLWRKVPAASSGLTCSGSGFTVVPPEAYRLPGTTTNPCAK